MASDLDPVAAHRRLAPHAIAAPRAVDEQPATGRVAAATETVAVGLERQRRRQQLVRDAVPTGGGSAQRVVGTQPEVDTREGRIQRGPPGGGGQLGLVGEGPDELTQRAQPLQLLGRRERIGRGDVVGAQEFVGIRRVDEMVVGRVPDPRSPTVVRAGTMRAVGEAQRGLRSQSPCNGIHGR